MATPSFIYLSFFFAHRHVHHLFSFPLFWLNGCWLSQPEAACHFSADSSSRQVKSVKVWMWPMEGVEGGIEKRLQCCGVKFAALLQGANQHLTSVCSSKTLTLLSVGWIYHLCCNLNQWCQDGRFTFGSSKSFQQNVSSVKKEHLIRWLPDIQFHPSVSHLFAFQAEYGWQKCSCSVWSLPRYRNRNTL